MNVIHYSTSESESKMNLTTGMIASLALFVGMCHQTYAVEMKDVLTPNSQYYEIVRQDSAELSRGYWEVFVTLSVNITDVENVRELLRDKATKLNNYVQTADCSRYGVLTAGDKQSLVPVCDSSWKDEMRQRLEHLMNPPHRTTITRVKRGLINAIG